MLDNPSAQVIVTNKNSSWKIVDRYGGTQYTFAPGEPVKVAAEVAEHIFGYGLDAKERFKKFMRMGIANHPKGREMWDRVSIKPVGGVAPTGAVREAA